MFYFSVVKMLYCITHLNIHWMVQWRLDITGSLGPRDFLLVSDVLLCQWSRGNTKKENLFTNWDRGSWFVMSGVCYTCIRSLYIEVPLYYCTFIRCILVLFIRLLPVFFVMEGSCSESPAGDFGWVPVIFRWRPRVLACWAADFFRLALGQWARRVPSLCKDTCREMMYVVRSWACFLFLTIIFCIVPSLHMYIW